MNRPPVTPAHATRLCRPIILFGRLKTSEADSRPALCSHDVLAEEAGHEGLGVEGD